MTSDDILKNLNRRFDHALLRSDATEKDIVAMCAEAREHDFYSVAVNPCWAGLAHEALAGSEVKVLGVSGFPLGASRTDLKIEEAIRGVRDGAEDIDMVANIGWLADDRYSSAEQEIKAVRDALPFSIVLKVIIEAGMLTIQQQVDATRSVVNGGAQFVKTCTGFFGGATVPQVQTLVGAAAGDIEVKASGGIKTLDQCRSLLEVGATRLGSSASVAIMAELSRS
ncbi:MAG: deoxyribose-phosphate aldolase [candidate division Zixibacteria bacterium]|nr:deoxyribose-phosphate aldolase [candidate division Zixibacteria bacterium]